MTSEVGSGQVSIVPTFKGFRKAVAAETDATAKASTSSFTKGFTAAGISAGKGFSSGMTPGLKAAQAEISKTSSALSTARLKEQDAAGRVRVAETALANSRSRFAADSVQVVRAEERLAAAERALQSTQESVISSTTRLAAAKVSAASASGTMASSYRSAGGASASKFLTGFSEVFGGVLGANIVTGVGFAIGRGVHDVISSGINAGFDSISLASGLQQSTGGIEAVFGSAADSVKGFAKSSATSLGLARNDYQELAAVIGAQLKNSGVAIDKIGGKTNDLIKLGGDLAATYGGTTKDAVNALSSALRGERDPIERYGISLTQNAVNARAAALGFKEVNGALSTQASQVASLSLIYDQAAPAAGQFAAQSGQLAEQQQILQARLQDSQTALGTYLLPAFTSIVDYANTSLIPKLGTFIDDVGPKIGPAFEAAKPGVKHLLEQVSPLVDDITSLASSGGIDTITKGLGSLAQAADSAGKTIKPLLPAIKGITDGVDFLFNNPAAQWLANDPFGKVISDIGNPTRVQNVFGDVTGLFDTITKSATQKKPALDGQFLNFGVSSADSYASGFKSKSHDISSAYTASTSPAPGDLGFFNFGAQSGQGFAEGLSSKKAAAGAAATALAQEAVKAIKSTMKIQSPSRVTRGLGAFAGEGYALGLLDRTQQVQAAAQQISGASLVGVGGGGASGGGGSSSAPMMIQGTLDLGNGLTGVIKGHIADYDAERAATMRRGSRGF